ncbi:MAG: hypothetical protein AAGA61_06030 [Pseudomonadota bacterium]
MQHLDTDDARSRTPAPDVVQAIRLGNRLAAAGVRTALRFHRGHVFTAGVAARAAGPDCLGDADAKAVETAQKYGLVSSLRLPGLSIDASSVAALESMLAPAPERTELIIDVQCSPASRSQLDALNEFPSIYTWLGADRTIGDWCRTPGSVLTIPAGVRSGCPLLTAESANTVLPGIGISAPANTAWLSLGVDLVRFADRHGRICAKRLANALDVCVEAGDELMTHLSWVSPAQTADARKNRRLGISITGVGDLVVQSGDDPASLDCLYRWDRLLAAIHRRVWRRSRELAQRDGALPALTEHQPSARWCDDSQRRAWADRWFAAVKDAQVRHRNLLVLSPYALLPRGHGSHVAFADLLPVLAHADALSFSCPAGFRGWQAVDIKTFMGRMRAQIRRFNATAFVASGA